MCRFLAYQGEPIFLETLVCASEHSLVHQSLHAAECKTATNGDGFGIGWYGERDIPGLFRDLRPAWSDENLRSVCTQVRSGQFFAHVRAATGTVTSRANCHPFAHGRWMFMHNGQIGGYTQIKRRLEAALPDEFYHARQGTTDSEVLFLLALAEIAKGSPPPEAVAATLGFTKMLMRDASVDEALRFTAALTDGETLYCFRVACDDRPASLYFSEQPGAVTVASEPVDRGGDHWQAVPRGAFITVRRGTATTVAPFPWAAEAVAA
ncbi:class II glutamine amidotransferase [Chelatococcus daeguensis]|uniref:class II glutamine amidotransferase n=1 Tax=Chelatococcus daeguensis TaxID=444444 RepID=UPI0007ABE4EB|nr:class II glutamine amidotransferase [Chelatococcus daeguensis]KZE29216.1 class II glutamine amidotransferase [Chelatococcus daeguensis]MBM3083934.1 class II glutamine amidotransferase [Chelatococcus daeguensis]